MEEVISESLGRNIVIYSDGTGQRGGILFDERRSNIYKLYRATRCGPDTRIDPAKQLTYYDPGIGSAPGGLGFFGKAWRWLVNLVSQATGMGLTRNIIECYATILQLWQPGDRIFLIGFSRGAYTVRCLGGVLSFCGVPTTDANGDPLPRDPESTRCLAEIAVKKVYQHVSSPRDKEYVPQREALGRWFRRKYHSDNNGQSNVYPYFIGVFDTVASVATWSGILLVLGLLAAAYGVLGAIAGWALNDYFHTYIGLLIAFVVGIGGTLTWTHLRYSTELEDYSFWQTLHFTELRLRFYDNQLNKNVGYARHAISIDENRKSFPRVAWGEPRVWRNTGSGNPGWFRQYWFAGNHSDIGGSYAENESRLSDVALEWMVGEATELPNGLIVDRSLLNLYPDPLGMQHDERRTSIFKYEKAVPRESRNDATLHDSVLARFAATAVQQHDHFLPYRPESLRNHKDVAQYYNVPAPANQEPPEPSSEETTSLKDE